MTIPERMPCKYNTEHDLHARLHGTICRYKGVPYKVLLDFPTIFLRDLVTGVDVEKIKFDDPEFDISSPELGYMNLVLPLKAPKNYVRYIERLPIKRWRQGICVNHLMFSKIDGNEISHIPGWPVEMWMSTQGFKDMLQDNYPKLDKAFSILEEGEYIDQSPLGNTAAMCDQIAISKDVAMEKTKSGVIQIYFKADNVGWCAPGTRQINVKSSEMGWIISKYLSQFSWKVE